MQKRTLKEKRTVFRMLMMGKTQKEICRHLNTTEPSLSRWINSEDAKQVREDLLKTLDTHWEFLDFDGVI